MAIVLGKNISISGVSNARSFTVTGTAVEVDITKFGDTVKKIKKPLADITVEVECVDAPGISAGAIFTLGGTEVGNHKFICTNVAEDAPVDGIVTYTVSGSRAPATDN